MFVHPYIRKMYESAPDTHRAKAMAESPKPRKTRSPTSLRSPTDPLTEDLQCSICLDVFTNPVTTPCGHNFCKICLKECWDNHQDHSCPICKKTFNQKPELKVNTTLRDIVDHCKKRNHLKVPEVLCDICTVPKLKALKSCPACQSSYCKTHLERHFKVPGLKQHKLINPVKNLQDHLCQKHNRHLELFCRDDQTCVCVTCTVTEHKTHNNVPVEEESEMKKTQMKKTQTDVKQMIQDRMKKTEEIKRSVKLRKIYPSLCSPLDIKIWTGISINTCVSVETLRRALAELQDTLDKKLNQNVMKRIQQYAVDVTLDHDTAHPELILSEDGKQVQHGNIKHDHPHNDKRFDKYIIVLGKEGFSSGRFYFEVQVNGKTQWNLGVARESINRKGELHLCPKNGNWTLWQSSGNKYQACESSPVPLSLNVKLQKVGVFVDYEEGLVSFYDVESRSHIYSFTGQSFTEKLYPFLSPCTNDKGKNSAPFIITPVSYDE
ncbi:bloodthirsty-related gene family, member 9 isoform X3 [Megalobrama amblycephala]|uniref:bloodthirsty-related gene family, member 9 isoform X3 n=1 Tax=Megalobrama amblycephala TaxID=75352 RepID=UPI002013DE13|nr:bloodthirsty-related gene family, member 9 isoform X3 [Megalobrama amblycephala]